MNWNILTFGRLIYWQFLTPNGLIFRYVRMTSNVQQRKRHFWIGSSNVEWVFFTRRINFNHWPIGSFSSDWLVQLSFHSNSAPGLDSPPYAFARHFVRIVKINMPTINHALTSPQCSSSNPSALTWNLNVRVRVYSWVGLENNSSKINVDKGNACCLHQK